jgi:hypothetical protein
MLIKKNSLLERWLDDSEEHRCEISASRDVLRVRLSDSEHRSDFDIQRDTNSEKIAVTIDGKELWIRRCVCGCEKIVSSLEVIEYATGVREMVRIVCHACGHKFGRCSSNLENASILWDKANGSSSEENQIQAALINHMTRNAEATF